MVDGKECAQLPLKNVALALLFVFMSSEEFGGSSSLWEHDWLEYTPGGERSGTA